MDGMNTVGAFQVMKSARVMRKAVASLLGTNKEEWVEDLLEDYDKLREDCYAGVEDPYFLDFEKTKQLKLQ